MIAGEAGTVWNVHGDGATRAAVSRLLCDQGLRAREVASSAEARDALLCADGEAGLVLLDATIEGAEPLCRALLGRPEAAPALLLTLPGDAEPDPGLIALADDVLERPPDRSRWTPTIRAWARIAGRLAGQRAEATRWRSVLEAMDEGVAMIDLDGTIRCGNAALASMLGVEPAALTGAPLAERAAHLIPAGRPWPFERTLRGGALARDEWELGRRWLRSTSSPLRDGRGALVGAVTTIEDVTAEVRLRRRVAQAEAEAGVRAERIEQLERDARLYQALAGVGPRPDGRDGARPSLSRALPEVFCDAVEDFGRVLDIRLRRRGYREDGGPDGSAELRALAERLAGAGAGPRDVVELHSLALRDRSSGAQAAKANAYGEEGRLAVLELMGRLAEHYRDASARPGADARDRPPVLSE